MKRTTEKIIDLIDRVLWNARMDALTSPALWGRCSVCGETSPWVTNTRHAEDRCTRCHQKDLRHTTA